MLVFPPQIPHGIPWNFKRSTAIKKPRLPLRISAWSIVPLEKLTGSQLVKKFPGFYGNRRFNTAFTSAGHLSLSWASSIQFTPPHPTFWRSILILSSHLCLGLPSGLFLRFPAQLIYFSKLSKNGRCNFVIKYSNTHRKTKQNNGILCIIDGNFESFCVWKASLSRSGFVSIPLRKTM